MRREALAPRPDWPAKVEALGLDFHTTAGEPYWWEAACYAFTAAEIDVLEEATETVHGLCLEAVDRLIATDDLAQLDIKPADQRNRDMKGGGEVIHSQSNRAFCGEVDTMQVWL